MEGARYVNLLLSDSANGGSSPPFKFVPREVGVVEFLINIIVNREKYVPRNPLRCVTIGITNRED